MKHETLGRKDQEILGTGYSKCWGEVVIGPCVGCGYKNLILGEDALQMILKVLIFLGY